MISWCLHRWTLWNTKPLSCLLGSWGGGGVLLDISDWGVTPFFRPENVILHTRFQTSPASRGFSLAWLLSITKSFSSLVSLVVGLSQERRTKQTNYATDGELSVVNGNSHAREKPQSYPLKSTSVFRPGVGLERQQKDFLKSISNSHYYSFFLIRLKLKGQMLSHTLVVPSKQLGVPNDCFL